MLEDAQEGAGARRRVEGVAARRGREVGRAGVRAARAGGVVESCGVGGAAFARGEGVLAGEEGPHFRLRAGGAVDVGDGEAGGEVLFARRAKRES